MLIPVGIHENLTLSKDTKINEHGTLELAIEQATNDDQAMLAALAGNSVIQGEMKSSFRFYPPTATTFDGQPKTAADFAKELTVMRHQFMEYAKLFDTKENVEKALGGLAMFDGLGIPPEEMVKAFNALTKEEFRNKVVTNLSKKFLDFLKAHDAFNGTVKFRQKFIRQSKAKNFSTIPKSSFDTWIESMAIPKEQSKIAFTDYEKRQGYDNPDPVASSSAQSTETKKASDLFGTSGDIVTQPSLFS